MYTIVNLADKSKQSCNHKHVCARMLKLLKKKNPTCQTAQKKNPLWNCCGQEEFFHDIISFPARWTAFMIIFHWFFFPLQMWNFSSTTWKSISINAGMYRWHVQATAAPEVNIKSCNTAWMAAFPVWQSRFYRKPLRSRRIHDWFPPLFFLTI